MLAARTGKIAYSKENEKIRPGPQSIHFLECLFPVLIHKGNGSLLF